MRLGVRGDLELESPFLARDIDDEGPALALVAQPYCPQPRTPAIGRSVAKLDVLSVQLVLYRQTVEAALLRVEFNPDSAAVDTLMISIQSPDLQETSKSFPPRRMTNESLPDAFITNVFFPSRTSTMRPSS